MKQIEGSRDQKALQIIAGLEAPDYRRNYQPTYTQRDALIGAVSELLTTTPATSPKKIKELRDNLAHIGLTNGHSRLNIVGSCHESVRMRDPTYDIRELVEPILIEHETVLSSDPHALHVQRTAGQSVKPRSSEHEQLPDGSSVLSFFGEGVNGADVTQRTPDPSRMVAMALQSRDITTAIQNALDEHIPIAHEMLLLPFEEAFVRVDEQDGKKYLLSADLPWIGVRTNNPEGPHVALLSTVENVVGVKIGANSDAQHIRRLADALNPRNEHGKLIFMLRIGHNINKTLELLDAIKLHAPNALLLFDIHAVTRSNSDGIKIRCVEDVISQAKLLKNLCTTVGLTFNGLHLETTTEDRYECIDSPGELPKHSGQVDPRLNNQQLQRVLTEV